MSFGAIQSFQTLIYNGPIAVICLVGLILALSRWQRHPTVSLFVFLATGLTLFWSLLAFVMYSWGLQYLAESEFLGLTVQYLFLGFGTMSTLVRATSLIFLLCAAFSSRGGPPKV